MAEYDPRKHAKALKDLEASKARVQRLIDQADAIRKDAEKYEALASGLINARKHDVMMILGQAVYERMYSDTERFGTISEWLAGRDISLSVADIALCQADFDKTLPSKELRNERRCSLV